MKYSGFDPQLKLAMAPQFAAHMAGEKVYPIGIEISPSGVCQASCDFCFYANTGELGNHRKVFLDTARTMNLLGECMDVGIKAVTWTGGGEPSLHPDIASFVEWTNNEFGLEQGMFTNALAMPKYDPSLLQWVRVTMTDKPYKPECIRPLRACKTLGFAFNYAGLQDNDYLCDTLAMAQAIGADYVQVRPALKFHGETVDIAPPAFTHPLMQVTGYKFEEAKIPHGTHYKTCEGFKFLPYIWEDGSVDVCAYMRKHEGFRLGNIYEKSLKEILDSAPPSVAVHPNCQVCCRLHEFNLMVNKARNVEDKNFP